MVSKAQATGHRGANGILSERGCYSPGCDSVCVLRGNGSLRFALTLVFPTGHQKDYAEIQSEKSGVTCKPGPDSVCGLPAFGCCMPARRGRQPNRTTQDRVGEVRRTA